MEEEIECGDVVERLFRVEVVAQIVSDIVEESMQQDVDVDVDIENILTMFSMKGSSENTYFLHSGRWVC